MAEPTYGECLAEELFSPDGLLSRSLTEYEHRPAQVEMAAAIADVLKEGGRLLVEAEPGTGKTLACLGPAVLLGQRVIISTGTRTLQDQILHKDLPILEKCLGQTFNVCVLKGRHNYLCPRRYQQFLQDPVFREREEVELFEKVKKWAGTTATGDVAEVSGVPEDFGVWRDICCSADLCRPVLCSESGESFIHRARQEAAASDVVIVNHHLFFSDLNLRLRGGGDFPIGILPSYAAVIFDEAHALEDIATDYFGFTISRNRIDDLARSALHESVGHGNEVANCLPLLSRCSDLFFSSLPVVKPHLGTAVSRGGRASGCVSDGSRSKREVTADRRRLRSEEISATLVSATESLVAALRGLERMAEQLGPEGLKAIARRAGDAASDIEFMMRMEDSSYVTWIQLRGESLSVSASPIDLSGILREELFDRVRGAVLTSATLSSGRSFNYIRERLGLDRAAELILPSPFDHGRQAVLFVPRMSAEPNTSEWSEDICPLIESLLRICEGRAFVLFTSYRNMRFAHTRLKDRIPHRVLIQGEDSRALLLEEFRRDRSSVLFATASFWQGVDVQGDALSCVIIDKLPFSSPGDPLVEARSEAIVAEGEDAFLTYQIPRAVIALKQGLGRLIRSRADRGILAVLDSRLHTRSYGQTFLEGLPPWPVVDSIDALKEVTRSLLQMEVGGA